MNTRICSVVAALTLLTLSSGCGGIRNFLFGRGARCGLCSNSTPQFGNTMQTPPGSYGPTCQTPQCPTPYQAGPSYQGVATAPSTGCGCNEYAAYSGQPCGTCGDNCAVQPGGCGSAGGCGTAVGSYVADPYMQSGIVGSSIPYDGQIISDTVVGQQPVGGQVYPGTIQDDNFSARKFDADGNKILWEEPLPQDTKAL